MPERQMQLEDWLDDLCVRFIINLPEDNLSSVERICFQVEEAQWFYEDFIRPLDPNLPSLSLRNFCLRIFSHCPLLSAFAADGRDMQAFEEFLTYKKRIPVRGAILLNESMDAAVLVKGWKKGANWSFPRGKINKDEDDLICAIREVYEETGYDLEAAGLVPADRQVKHIEVNMREQQMRLYVFRNVPMDTFFEPRTRKEISKIQWWRLSELPAFKKKNQQERHDAASSTDKFYMVAPFLVPLRKWVAEQKKRDSKRTVSNPHLAAAMSHDELMTEEDHGNESSTQVLSFANAPKSGSLEEATEALGRLLKLQPPTQGLQPDAIHSNSAAKGSGQALLALLQNKPSMAEPPRPSGYAPQTPLDQTITQSSMPNPPHHQHPYPPKFSAMPPPPTFPIQPSHGTFSYQDRTAQSFDQRGLPKGVHQGNYPSTRDPHHSNQSQQLVHPQPLPPQVQRAVFTGGPVHAPVVPQPFPQTQAQPRPNVTGPIPLPQFPGLHAPMVPPVVQQPPQKLTGHSLALLNAFKSREQPPSGSGQSNNLPPHNFSHGPPDSQAPRNPMQELPAELSQPTPTAPQVSKAAPLQSIQSTFAPREPISATHRSTLLDMFKSPTAQQSILAEAPSATALPTSNTPSAVELSAVEPLSSNTASTSAVSNNLATSTLTGGNETIPRLNPEANLPFRALSILARPSENGKEPQLARPGPSTGKTHIKSNGNKKIPSAATKANASQTPAKLFQPQILKRPQAGPSGEMEPPPSPKLPQVVPHTQHGKLPPSTSQAALERQAVPLPDHRQSLLSLFGKPAPLANPVSGNPSTEGANTSNLSGASTRSRVGSLASVDAASRRGSQTPISPADKGFLLNYLDAVANGSQR